MTTIAIQYLEHTAGVSAHNAREKLRAAFDILPIEKLIIGWNLSESLVTMCADECRKNGTSLYLWQPLLTSDGLFSPDPAWYTVGLNNKPVPGFEQLPEFTFACPNRPQVREAVINHIQSTIKNGPYQGIFLDRIRFPSPTTAPDEQLACFCDACEKKAGLSGLDLNLVRKSIAALLQSRSGTETFVHLLFNPCCPAQEEEQAVHAFLLFRLQSISSLIHNVAAVIKKSGLSIGLDCFSSSLTHIVGQNLRSLAACSDWIKIMCYAHTYGVAGLPYEFIQLINWLVQKKGFTEYEAIALVAQATGLPFPHTIKDIRQKGFSPKALEKEIQKARDAGAKNLFAGIELVDQESITLLHDEQIKADLAAFKNAGAQGLVLSWDLWCMPMKRLKQVKRSFEIKQQ